MTLAGFIDPAPDDPDHPFRTLTMLRPDPRGTMQRHADFGVPAIGADLLRAMWRPCVADLLVTSVVAIVAMAGL